MTANFNMTTNLILTNVIVLQLFAPMDIFVVVKENRCHQTGWKCTKNAFLAGTL